MSSSINFVPYASVAAMPNADDASHLRYGIVGTEIIAKDSSGNVYYFENTRRPSAATATTNATPTVAYTSPVLPELDTMMIRCRVVGRKTDNTSALVGWIECGYRRAAAGNIVALGSANKWTLEDSGGAPDISMAVNTGTQVVELSVTGIAAENWTWQTWAEISLYP